MSDDSTRHLSTRRAFLGTAAAATAASVLPLGATPPESLAQSAASTGAAKNRSNFGGVQVGTITYSFKDVPGNVDALLQACLDAGVGSIQLQAGNYGVEDYLGAPKRPATLATAGGGGGATRMVYGQPGARKANPSIPDQVPIAPVVAAPPQPPVQLTPEQQAARTAETTAYNQELAKWRVNMPEDRFAALGKRFRDAGVNIHILEIGTRTGTEAEMAYAFRAAKAIGASATGGGGLLSQDYKRLLPFAERYGIYILFHNHYEYAEGNPDVDGILSASKMTMLNLDIGHYFGSTGKDPREFIRKYHSRIFNIHIKDKTSPTNAYWQNTNQVWGQGETPIVETLRFIKENGYKIHCDVELEYDVKPWAKSVDQVRACVNYCRQALL